VGPYIARPDATWFLDSVTLAGRDVLVDAIDVRAGETVTDVVATLTQHRGSLAGTVLTGNR
jgi:hypothetical protein